MSTAPTVVINAAGMGTRLGMGVPKSLIELHGRPLVHWQLDVLDAVEDVRIVVGYQADALIKVVRQARPNVLVVFNHAFQTTNTASSLHLGAQHSQGEVLSLDGDLLVTKATVQALLAAPSIAIGVSDISTEQPVFVQLDAEGRAISFSRERGDAEWTGLVKLPAARVRATNSYVYEMLEPYLPLPTVRAECCEIDTPGDYNSAAAWVERHLLRREKS